VDTGREMRGGQWQVLHLLRQMPSTLLAPPASPLLTAARNDGLDAQELTVRGVLRLAPSFRIVHAHDARAHSIASITTARPIVVARRVAFPIGRSPISRWKYRRAAHFIAVSDCVRRMLMAGGVPEEKITVVYD